MSPTPAPIRRLAYLGSLLLILCILLSVFGSLMLFHESIQLPRSLRVLREYRLVTAAGLLAGAFITGVSFIALFRAARKRALRNLDASLRLPGFDALPHLSGRRFRGVYRERRADIHLLPLRNRRYMGSMHTTHYAGHAVDLFLAAKTGTRLSVTLPGEAIKTGSVFYQRLGDHVQHGSSVAMVKKATPFLAARSGLTKIDGTPLGLGEAMIYTANRPWGEYLLSDDAIISAIRDLLRSRDVSAMMSVVVMPGAVRLRLRARLEHISGTALEGWMEALDRIAAAIEALPRPEPFIEETEGERIVREEPERIHRKVKFLALLFILLLAAFGAILGFLIAR